MFAAVRDDSECHPMSIQAPPSHTDLVILQFRQTSSHDMATTGLILPQVGPQPAALTPTTTALDIRRDALRLRTEWTNVVRLWLERIETLGHQATSQHIEDLALFVFHINYYDYRASRMLLVVDFLERMERIPASGVYGEQLRQTLTAGPVGREPLLQSLDLVRDEIIHTEEGEREVFKMWCDAGVADPRTPRFLNPRM
jgi:hypothetical protein